MHHRNDPERLLAINRHEVLHQSIILLMRGSISVIANITKGLGVCDKCLALGGGLALALGVADEGPLGGVGEVNITPTFRTHVSPVHHLANETIHH